MQVLTRTARLSLVIMFQAKEVDLLVLEANYNSVSQSCDAKCFISWFKCILALEMRYHVFGICFSGISLQASNYGTNFIGLLFYFDASSDFRKLMLDGLLTQ